MVVVRIERESLYVILPFFRIVRIVPFLYAFSISPFGGPPYRHRRPFHAAPYVAAVAAEAHEKYSNESVFPLERIHETAYIQLTHAQQIISRTQNMKEKRKNYTG